MIRCGHCGCSLVGEVKKGRYVYYLCTGYRGRYPEPYTRPETLEAHFASRLRDLVVPAEVAAWLQDEPITNETREQAATEETLRRNESELQRLDAWLETLYEDRLDHRIDTSTYDRKAAEIRQNQQHLRTRTNEAQSKAMAPATEALDLMLVTSKAAEPFDEQPASEQRRLLRLVLEQTTWQAGELRMCFREPFEGLRLIELRKCHK